MMDRDSLLNLKISSEGSRWFTKQRDLTSAAVNLTVFAVGCEQIASADCDHGSTTPRGLWRPKGPGESWSVLRRALVLGVFPPISVRSIWRASVLMRRSPASRQPKELALVSSQKYWEDSSDVRVFQISESRVSTIASWTH